MNRFRISILSALLSCPSIAAEPKVLNEIKGKVVGVVDSDTIHCERRLFIPSVWAK